MIFKVFQVNSMKELLRTIFLCYAEFELAREHYTKKYAKAKRLKLVLHSQIISEK